MLGVVLHGYLREPRRGAADDPEGPALTRPSAGQTLRVIGGTPTALALMLAFLCANFVAMVLLAWMPSYLSETFHLSLSLAGLTATACAQLASLAGAPLGGWLADRLRQLTPSGRVLVQAVGVLGGAPFVCLCGQTRSVLGLTVALTAWGLFKRLYDANIFAALFDVVGPQHRGTAAGLMNLVGWLGGGGSAPLVIGYLAEGYGLGRAISSATLIYLAAGAVLLATARWLLPRDLARPATS